MSATITLTYGFVGDMFDKNMGRKATTITDMYAALDLGQRTIPAVLKRQDGKIVNELNKETSR